jgi:hypothetical protein
LMLEGGKRRRNRTIDQLSCSAVQQKSVPLFCGQERKQAKRERKNEDGAAEERAE